VLWVGDVNPGAAGDRTIEALKKDKRFSSQVLPYSQQKSRVRKMGASDTKIALVHAIKAS
jgi:hypothetical protein